MSNEQDQTNHTWFREQIATALAHGLDTADQERFDSHAAECPTCAAELQSLQQMEQRMTTLFAHPTANLEDRIINSLRQEGRPVLGPSLHNLRIHPAIQKAATGIAAAIVLAGFGYLAEQRINNDESPTRVALSSSSPWTKSINANEDRSFYDSSVATTRVSSHSIGSLRSNVQSLMNSGKYQDALPVLDQMIKIDPHNDYATGLRPLVEDKAHLLEQRRYREDFNRQFTKQLNRGEPSTTYDDVLRYPSNWPDISEMRDQSGKSQAGEGSKKTPAAAPAPTPAIAAGTLSLDQPDKPSTVIAKNLDVKYADAHNFIAADTDGDGIADAKLGRLTHGIASNYFKPTQIALGESVTPEASKTIVGFELQQMGNQTTPPAQQHSAFGITVSGDGSKIPLAYAPQSEAEKKSNADFTAPLASAQTISPQQPADATPATATPPTAPPQHEAAIAPTSQKVIRNGQIEFEVDRFDSAFATVSKLTTESQGYVGTSDSEKLPNGKVKGTVTVRVPPDHLDTLLLQLRGIGDLKSQKLDANDVSKHYTDLESELRADRAMEERLLGIIKDGKGQIKDLLAAEKELGNWREKIENIVGEMRYLDSQVAMSTLVITLYERDIKTPATAQETENVEAGMEAADVEKARTDALKAIEDAKGRVIQSDLKRYDAGQFGATIVAEVPPDTAGPMLDRLKQIGKIARLDIQRRQTTDANADAPVSAPQKVQKKDTRLNLSIYNLANVAPRITTTINLAAEDVEKTYGNIRERVIKAGGRVIASDLARNKSDKTTGTISFDVPSEQADALMNDLRGMGEVMRLTVTDNPDVNNVTTAKRGYALQLLAAAAVAPRETTTLQIATTKVAEAREKILAAASSGMARVLVSQLNETDPANPNAAIEIDVPRTALALVEKTINESGDTVSRNVSRSSDTENTPDTKVKLQITLLPADKLPPRETTTLTIETTDVDAAVANLQQSATQSNGKIVESNETKDQTGGTKATLVVELPQEKSPALVDQAKQAGTVRAAQSSRNLQLPSSALAKARLELTLVTPDTIVQPGTGPLATIRNGLATSVKALLWSLELIVIGLCTVLPFAIVLWMGWKLLKRRKSSPASA